MHDHYANECFSEGDEGSRYVSTTRPEMNGIPTLDLDGGAVEIYCRHENNETSLGIRAKFAAVQYYENYDHLFYRCYNDKESCGQNGAYLEQPYYTCFNGALDENGCTGFTSDVIYSTRIWNLQRKHYVESLLISHEKWLLNSGMNRLRHSRQCMYTTTTITSAEAIFQL